ncbi:emopamil-binding protein-like isoform X2 [Tursiops truncatus]|uniref:emopamil-binding protein-like isoform X2 n=1 Tax=Tursiops truncatus TaxID=9739 RepID=UPI003CCF511A
MAAEPAHPEPVLHNGRDHSGSEHTTSPLPPCERQSQNQQLNVPGAQAWSRATGRNLGLLSRHITENKREEGFSSAPGWNVVSTRRDQRKLGKQVTEPPAVRELETATTAVQPSSSQAQSTHALSSSALREEVVAGCTVPRHCCGEKPPGSFLTLRGKRNSGQRLSPENMQEG